MPYNAGSAGTTGYGQGLAPLAALGLVEFPEIELDGVPLRIHDGTFVLSAAGGLHDTPDVRSTDTTAALTHGAYPASSFYEGRGITVEGYVLAESMVDVWQAFDLLKRLNLSDPTRLFRLEALLPGWEERRWTMVRPAGPLIVAEPGAGSVQRKPYRDWQLPLFAPDPRLYGTTVYDKASEAHAGVANGAVGSTSAFLPNEGTFPAPLRWVVTGPWEKPALIDDARSRSIAYEGSVPTGSTLIVDSLARTATLNGANVYANLSRFDDLEIPPGGATYRTANRAQTSSGAGTWRAEHRAVWV